MFGPPSWAAIPWLKRDCPDTGRIPISGEAEAEWVQSGPVVAAVATVVAVSAVGAPVMPEAVPRAPVAVQAAASAVLVDADCFCVEEAESAPVDAVLRVEVVERDDVAVAAEASAVLASNENTTTVVEAVSSGPAVEAP